MIELSENSNSLGMQWPITNTVLVLLENASIAYLTTYGFARKVSISSNQSSNMVHADYIMIIDLNTLQNKKVYLSFWHSQEIIHKTRIKNLGSEKKRKI